MKEEDATITFPKRNLFTTEKLRTIEYCTENGLHQVVDRFYHKDGLCIHMVYKDAIDIKTLIAPKN